MRVILATAGAGGSPATGAGGALAGILLGPQRITAFKPPYFADRYIENIWIAANKAGKEHRLGRKKNRSKNPNRISTSTNCVGGL